MLIEVTAKDGGKALLPTDAICVEQIDGVTYVGVEWLDHSIELADKYEDLKKRLEDKGLIW